MNEIYYFISCKKGQPKQRKGVDCSYRTDYRKTEVVMKKILSLLLVLAMATSLLAACGGGAPSETETNEPAAETPAKEEAAKEETPAAEAVDGDPIEIMKNVNARKAIAMAFDKVFITDEILGNGSLPVDYFVPKGLASDPDGNDFRSAYPDGWNSFDPAMAADYWAKAQEEVGFDTVTIELLNYDSESSRKIGEHIKAQLEANLAGLTVTINAQPFENKLALSADGEYQLNFAGWGPDYPDPLTFLDMWVTGGGFNEIGFHNEDYDNLVNASKNGDLVTKPFERWEAMQ
jgi:oligopeptide transport system substrate-binding protein